MIVRISTEGQYRVGGSTLDRINDIDARLMAALQNNDGSEFSRQLDEIITLVRQEGQPVPTQEIVESDLVLPPPDTAMEEARRLFETRVVWPRARGVYPT